MKKDIKTIVNELNTLKNQLSEAYIFNDQEQMPGEQPNPEMMGQQQMMAQGGSEEEQALHAQEVIQHEPIIGKIRETAIEGLKKYSDHPTSNVYSFFKKVLMEADKVLTDSEGK